MAVASERQYEALISALQAFISVTEENCQTLRRAGLDCVGVTSNDPAAVKANAIVQKCVKEIGLALDDVAMIEQALEYELEDIRHSPLG